MVYAGFCIFVRLFLGGEIIVSCKRQLAAVTGGKKNKTTHNIKNKQKKSQCEAALAIMS